MPKTLQFRGGRLESTTYSFNSILASTSLSTLKLRIHETFPGPFNVLHTLLCLVQRSFGVEKTVCESYDVYLSGGMVAVGD